MKLLSEFKWKYAIEPIQIGGILTGYSWRIFHDNIADVVEIKGDKIYDTHERAVKGLQHFINQNHFSYLCKD